VCVCVCVCVYVCTTHLPSLNHFPTPDALFRNNLQGVYRCSHVCARARVIFNAVCEFCAYAQISRASRDAKQSLRCWTGVVNAARKLRRSIVREYNRRAEQSTDERTSFCYRRFEKGKWIQRKMDAEMSSLVLVTCDCPHPEGDKIAD